MLKDIKLSELLTPSDELIEAVKEHCDSIDEEKDLEDVGYLIFNNNKYYFGIIESDNWESDDGKYESKQIIGQLMCSETKEKYNLFAQQCLCRSGSYYSDYMYMNETPELFIMEEEFVPEIIIPAHNNNVLKKLGE